MAAAALAQGGHLRAAEDPPYPGAPYPGEVHQALASRAAFLLAAAGLVPEAHDSSKAASASGLPADLEGPPFREEEGSRRPAPGLASTAAADPVLGGRLGRRLQALRVAAVVAVASMAVEDPRDRQGLQGLPEEEEEMIHLAAVAPPFQAGAGSHLVVAVVLPCLEVEAESLRAAVGDPPCLEAAEGILRAAGAASRSWMAAGVHLSVPAGPRWQGPPRIFGEGARSVGPCWDRSAPTSAQPHCHAALPLTRPSCTHTGP